MLLQSITFYTFCLSTSFALITPLHEIATATEAAPEDILAAKTLQQISSGVGARTSEVDSPMSDQATMALSDPEGSSRLMSAYRGEPQPSADKFEVRNKQGFLNSETIPQTTDMSWRPNQLANIRTKPSSTQTPRDTHSSTLLNTPSKEDSIAIPPRQQIQNSMINVNSRVRKAPSKTAIGAPEPDAFQVRNLEEVINVNTHLKPLQSEILQAQNEFLKASQRVSTKTLSDEIAKGHPLEDRSWIKNPELISMGTIFHALETNTPGVHDSHTVGALARNLHRFIGRVDQRDLTPELNKLIEYSKARAVDYQLILESEKQAKDGFKEFLSVFSGTKETALKEFESLRSQVLQLSRALNPPKASGGGTLWEDGGFLSLMEPFQALRQSHSNPKSARFPELIRQGEREDWSRLTQPQILKIEKIVDDLTNSHVIAQATRSRVLKGNAYLLTPVIDTKTGQTILNGVKDFFDVSTLKMYIGFTRDHLETAVNERRLRLTRTTRPELNKSKLSSTLFGSSKSGSGQSSPTTSSSASSGTFMGSPTSNLEGPYGSWAIKSQRSAKSTNPRRFDEMGSSPLSLRTDTTPLESPRELGSWSPHPSDALYRSEDTSLPPRKRYRFQQALNNAN